MALTKELRKSNDDYAIDFRLTYSTFARFLLKFTQKTNFHKVIVGIQKEVWKAYFGRSPNDLLR